MKDRLALFDLDGTLLDTVRSNYEAYRWVACEFGKKWNISEEDFKLNYFGKSYKFFLPEITHANADECKKMHLMKEDIYEDYLKKYARKNSNLISICNEISKCYYIVLVTTASKKNTEKVLKLFLNDIDFDMVITGDDVTHLKPNTEAWNKARERFGISKERTIVFEDKREYVISAVDDGMNSYQVFMPEG